METYGPTLEDTLPGLLGFAAAIYIVYLLFKRFNNKLDQEKSDRIQTRKRAEEGAVEIIKKNRKSLAIRRSQTVSLDPYGKEDKRVWIDKEIPYFIAEHINPNVIDAIELDEVTLINKIDKAAKSFDLSKSQTGNKYNPKMTGVEYEHFCQEQLRRLKWSVTTTKSSGDQGVDLIAKREGQTIAIQCKRHSKPISNKAVQEIFSGMKYYDIDQGIVISNNKFTASAANLAFKNKIRLIHHDNLESL